MSKTYVTLDEFMNERGDFVKQVVYKVDGDFNGNITGDNVTVIIMGDGNINGNISSKDGEVVLIKGDINGDVEADKIVCPKEPVKSCNYCEYFNGYSCAIFNVRPKKVCSCYRQGAS